MREQDKKQPFEEYKAQEQPQYEQNQEFGKEQQSAQSWEQSKGGKDDIEKIVDNFKKTHQKDQEKKAAKADKSQDKAQKKLSRQKVKNELKKIKNEEKSLKQEKTQTKQQTKDIGRER